MEFTEHIICFPGEKSLEIRYRHVIFLRLLQAFEIKLDFSRIFTPSLYKRVNIRFKSM